MRILYLSPKKMYLTKMSRTRYHTIRTLGKYAEVIWSGTGWEGYDEGLDLKENINKIYKGEKPDFIMCYNPYLIKGLANINIPTAVAYNEMGTLSQTREYTLREIVENNVTLVICHHHNEMLYPEFDEIRKRMVSIPHCIEESFFYDYGLEKEIDVLLIGALNTRYPLRIKFAQAIEAMQKNSKYFHYHVGILDHPSYRIPDAFTDGECIRYARAINASKIVVSCSGIYRCRYAKFAEVPACRTLLMSDFPDEDQTFFRKFVAEVDADDTVEELIEKIVYYLEHEKERNMLTDIGYELTHADYTKEDYVRRLLSKMESVLGKKRGQV